MKDRSRLFGNNVKYYLNKNELSEEQFAKKLGYTSYYLQQIMDARVILDQQSREKIAKELSLKLEDMYIERSDEDYAAVGCIECRGRFNNPENKKLVLDLFDMYCDIQEILAMED